MILFDTDTLTHFSHGNDNVRRRIAAAGEAELAIAVVTRNEVLRGRADSLLKAADENELRKAAERFQRTEELLSAFVIVGFDEVSIAHFGTLRRRKEFNKMGRADMLIACIALACNALLVTRNTRDYKDVAGLRLDNWVD